MMKKWNLLRVLRYEKFCKHKVCALHKHCTHPYQCAINGSKIQFYLESKEMGVIFSSGCKSLLRPD